ncbi:hypothetical protein RB623_09875 [Mesorhizobium sp. LHD-90]|uniref:hypothetical protein n=1 Tax=Mesorhizobium sp. LHD-90 TaxID=3071414 RepID=UPI0027DF294A|nr:hypothetical protein [Mesorhizobium sp. LHD-90]MDQ6434356.1 hypothetical protein [Mesorhizobium sp. LHD-90]
MIDLKAYTCRAVIDWLELRVVLDRSTQERWINDEIRHATGDSPWVEDLDDPAEGTKFRIRFQEPLLGEVKKAVEAIDRKWKLLEPPEFRGMEISFDARPRVYSEEALAWMFGVLVRTHLPSRDVITDLNDRPRFAWGKAKEQTGYVLAYNKVAPKLRDEFLLRTDKDLMTPFDATYYAGAKGSSSSRRTMVKVIDEQNKATGAMKILPDGERRVRLEVTLLESELRKIGITSIDDLAAFSFQKFQGLYFKFLLPTFEQPGRRSTLALQAVTNAIEQDRRKKFLVTGIVGLEAMDEVKRREREAIRKRSKKSVKALEATSRRGAGRFSTMVQYEALTRQVIHALRHLGLRQRRSVR